jgi:hypothetical protein
LSCWVLCTFWIFIACWVFGLKIFSPIQQVVFSLRLLSTICLLCCYLCFWGHIQNAESLLGLVSLSFLLPTPCFSLVVL